MKEGNDPPSLLGVFKPNYQHEVFQNIQGDRHQSLHYYIINFSSYNSYILAKANSSYRFATEVNYVGNIAVFEANLKIM